MATAAGRKARAKAPGGGARKPAKARAEPRRRLTWPALTLILVGGALALRLGVNALDLVPVHSGEARHWAYAGALDWGYFADPPLMAAVMRATAEFLGDSVFALRLAAPLAHALAAWMIYLTGAYLWDGRTGFWAAAGYTLAPGVAYSSMTFSPEPLLLAAWAVALYTLVRGLGARGPGWWIACGMAIGAGLLADRAMILLPLALVGFLAVSREAERSDWRGTGISCGVALLVCAPNIVWHAADGFASMGGALPVAQGGDGTGSGGPARLLAAQLAVLGPPFFLALFPALLAAGPWQRDWGMRLVVWQCWLPLGAALALAVVAGADPARAAPAYIGGALAAARWLLGAGWQHWLRAQLALGATLGIVLWTAAGLYAVRASELPAAADPFAGARLGARFCERALEARAERDAAVLLATDRERLSECMFRDRLGWGEVALWNPDLAAENHHELMSTLRDGDDRPMILAVTGEAAPIARRFSQRIRIETGEIATHADRTVPYRIWLVQGFNGYDRR